ncbi:MAG: hypothetical protein C3F13_03960 [Anaerolineales bacterium]|nr:hypothetical protein [Anaerolineae bacterium]PWB55830.1 MAG: hypothetical protein C3F13_03960 [Anaerolineales bacterium]
MRLLEIGRLLRAGTTGFVVGCQVAQIDAPSFGALVRVALDGDYQVYGLIHDIHIDDDGLVRQLVTAGNVDEAVIADNRINRNVPLELSVLTVGYQLDGKISHLLPPRPPLSLDVISLCSTAEIRQFTSAGRFGYFRHVLRSVDLPVGELLAAHIKQAAMAQTEAGNTEWKNQATQELITLLRDDYVTLMSVLGALGDI